MENQTAITIRVPNSIYKKVQEIAVKERRSLNAQFLVIIEKGLKNGRK